MKSMMKDAAILLAITVCAGLILGFVYQLTKEPIAAQELKAKMEASKEVFADAATFETLEYAPVEAPAGGGGKAAAEVGGVMTALDASGNTLGYVLTITSHEGYGGDITFTMGVRTDGTLNGISILTISETPGLGMKAEDVLKPQFENKKAEEFTYTKSGAAAESEIDAISGATITTNAFVNSVNAGLEFFRTQLQEGGSIS